MATFALITWPFVVLLLFALMGPARGLIWATITGYLFLPERFGFDIPSLPDYDKFTAMAFSSVVAFALFRPRDERRPITAPGFRILMWMLLAVLLMATVGTYMSNTSSAISGGRVLPPLTPIDIVNMALDYLVRLTPMFLAWRLLDRPDHYRELLIAIVAMACAYSLLVLFEIRMSPQLNNWIYGYFPHDWRQHIRGSMFRPIVFLQHGLWVGFFLLSAVLAAIGLVRNGSRPVLLIAIWLFLVLLVSSNTGAVLLSIILAPMLLMLRNKLLMRIAVVVAVAFLFYPQVKQMTQEPIARFQSYVASFSSERGASFQTRLTHETALLERGNIKPVFGWGGWGRSQIYNTRGNSVSISDGGWIIQFGKAGWAGYLSFFGLLVLPIFALARRVRRETVPPPVMALLMISTANLIYLVPNATLTPVGMLCFGALAAYAQYGNVKDEAEPSTQPTPDRKTRYTRFSQGMGASYRRS